MSREPFPRLQAQGLTIAYDRRVVSADLDLLVPVGGLTAVVGPNACGKSTLLRTMARLHRPSRGRVLLDGQDVHRLRTKEVACRVGLLTQSAEIPDRITVRDLVARGRSPHQSVFRHWSRADRDAVDRAMELTRVADLARRPVDELSGGQRQRVWLALVLAQETETILLDEPITFLDLARQIEVLELCRRLNRDESRTIVVVLHDLNLAARCATHMVVMKDGAVHATGSPERVLTRELLAEVFDLTALVVPDPVTGTPMVVPTGLCPDASAADAGDGRRKP